MSGFEGYLAFGGNEVANNFRARQIGRTADCSMDWIKGAVCAGIADATNPLPSTLTTRAVNLLTNPSFEAAGAPVTIATNLLTNPSMEAAGASAVLRTNLCTNPRMLTLTGWSNGSTGSVTQTATASGQQYDVTGTIVNTNIVTYQTSVITAAPGDLFGTSMQVTVPAGFPAVSLLMDAQEYVSGSATIYARGATLTVQPGQTVTIPSGILTVDASGNGFRSVLRFAASTPVGARIIVANCLVEKAGAVGPYFDGATAASGDFTYAWTSTVDASTSTQSGLSVTGWTAQNSYSYQSGAQVHSRSKSTACVLNAAVGAGCYTTFTQVIGTVYTLSAWVYSPTAVTMRAAYTNGTVSSGGTATSVPANTWTRVWVTGTAATSTTGFLSILTTVAPPAGTLIYIDDADAVASPALSDHFDGATPASGDFTYAWTGTADASTSVQRGLSLVGVTGSNAAAIQSSEWADAGVTSMRVVNTGMNGFTSLLDASGHSNLSSILTPGQTYTVLATLRLPAQQVGVISGYARSILVYDASSGNGFIIGYTQGQNAMGTQDLRLTFTVPASNTKINVRLYGGNAGNGDVWWDNLALVEGTYTDPAFNGDTPDADGYLYDWTGAPNASTSTKTIWVTPPAPGYSFSDIRNAPWYDDGNPASTEFYGFYCTRFDSVYDSTRTATVTEGVGDGGQVGGLRKATKKAKAHGLLMGSSRRGIEYGQSWLSAVLDANACGQHGADCGLVDLAWFTECPPARQVGQNDADYDAVVSPYRRYLHEVACISGPLITDTHQSGDAWAYEVDIVWQAERPWVYGDASPLTMQPSIPITVEDIVTNLAPYPSMELSDGSAGVVATNYVTNPSLEANGTGWSSAVGSSTGTSPAAYLTSGVSTDVAQNRTHSWRARVLGDGSTTASGTAAINTDYVVPIPSTAAANKQRISIGLWAAMFSLGGATGAALNGFTTTAYWLDASNNTLSSVVIGSKTDASSIAGANLVAASLLPPANATQVRVRTVFNIAWSSSATPASNSDIRMYVDALAVTTP